MPSVADAVPAVVIPVALSIGLLPPEFQELLTLYV